MKPGGEIKSGKIFVKEIFSDYWFRIPEYQRPYVWGYEQINDLLDDLAFAMKNKPEAEYFLGSFVFQCKPARTNDQEYDENDLLDGQQRLTTLLLLFAVIRDLTQDPAAKDICQRSIFQREDRYVKIPERTRLVFSIRDEVQSFIEEHIKTADGTLNSDGMTRGKWKHDASIQNMANAIDYSKAFFDDNNLFKPEQMLEFILNKVLMIFVSTEDLEDAFRLFTILNARGIPLRNSDILKSTNLGALESKKEKEKYARLWEEAEGQLGDEFDRLLYHIRAILVKDKARLGLLEEFEEKIYRTRHRSTSVTNKMAPLLAKGRDTFVFIERYLEHYQLLFSGDNHRDIGSYEFDNLIKIMRAGIPSNDWVPPLLSYYERFRFQGIQKFLSILDIKASADWISRETPTKRTEAMNKILRVIEDSAVCDEVIESTSFKFDNEEFLRAVGGPIYGKKFAKYLLLKLDFTFQNQDQKMHFETLSIEHILPQNPRDDSQWVKDYSSLQREELVDLFGNLVLITRRKNSSLGALDYSQKKAKYFLNNIDTCPNSLRVLQKYLSWTPEDLAENQARVLGELCTQYGMSFR